MFYKVPIKNLEEEEQITNNQSFRATVNTVNYEFIEVETINEDEEILVKVKNADN